jgi:hypothetical protein
MPCAGNATEACGGSWRLSLYTLPTTSAATVKTGKSPKMQRRAGNARGL